MDDSDICAEIEVVNNPGACHVEGHQENPFAHRGRRRHPAGGVPRLGLPPRWHGVLYQRDPQALMTRRVLLLGCGAQGRAALHDLITGDDSMRVVVADRDRGVEASLRRYPASRVAAKVLDATDETGIAALMRDADVVVEALP